MGRPLRSEQLEALLQRLGPDREQAGVRYEQLRRSLITVFGYRGCSGPDELADETLDRAGRRLLEMGTAFEGNDPTRFVFGVAANVARESYKRRPTLPLPETWEVPDRPAVGLEDDELRERCLDQCLERLEDSERSLVLGYYEGEKSAKIRHRSTLASEQGVSPNALRLRIHRITTRLRECVFECVGKAPLPRWSAGRAAV
ncbi:MAG: hypothetical protein ACHP85_08085 [Burkholderiales bacterium]|jgi:DNA-directed RNA polymerase specialized sigma24 family protein